MKHDKKFQDLAHGQAFIEFEGKYFQEIGSDGEMDGPETNRKIEQYRRGKPLARIKQFFGLGEK